MCISWTIKGLKYFRSLQILFADLTSRKIGDSRRHVIYKTLNIANFKIFHLLVLSVLPGNMTEKEKSSQP